MAVQEQTPYIEHIANGVTTSFALEFECKDKEHLIVLVDDIEPVVGAWSLIGGAVVFGTAPTNGKKITVQRNTPFRRDTNFQSYDNSLRPATINKDFDWIWYKLQELGVADWILSSRIDALKNYVDDRDDELRAYLMEEIHKQGVALDQLDEYYNYLMQRLAQIAVDKGWDASFVVDGDKTQKQINDNLLGDNGSKFVNLTLSNVANAVKKSLYETVIDQVINVKWFGAKGDWNTTTQTGTDDTVAIQNAINYYATLGSRRVGGTGAIKLPAGNYRYSSLTIPDNIGFNLSFIGDGKQTTHLWADHNDPNPAFDSKIEFVQFIDLTTFGALSDNIGYTNAKTVGFKGQLTNNYADIDVEFKNCGIFCWNEFANIYGRGFIADGCTIGLVQTLLNVVCSEDTVFIAGLVSNAVKTGMRHYTLRNNRFDGVGCLMKVTGTGAQKDHINDVIMMGNDALYVDRLIQADDATVKRALILGNNALMSFAGGVIQGKSFKGVSVAHNNFAKDYDDTVIPSSASQAINLILLSTGASEGVNVSHNNVKCLKSTPVNVGAGSKNIKVVHNQFDSAWEPNFGTSSGTKYIVYSAGDIDGLNIEGNQFTSIGATGTFKVFNDAVQTSKNTRVRSNLAPFKWNDVRLSFIPKLLVNGTASATASTASHGRYYLDDAYVYVEVMLSINPVESSGELAISLPSVAAVAENSAISTGYAGNGVIARYVGFTAAAGTAMSPVLVNPSNQQAELWKISNMTQARLTAADRSGTITLYATFKYRY